MELLSFEGADAAFGSRRQQCKKLEKFSGEPYEVDHIIPLSKGGLHHPMNFQNLPAVINRSKNDSIRDEDVTLFCKHLFDIK